MIDVRELTEAQKATEAFKSTYAGMMNSRQLDADPKLMELIKKQAEELKAHFGFA